MIASAMQPTPAQPSGPEMLPSPSNAITPLNPISRPSTRQGPKRSCTPKKREINAMISGMVAVRMPAIEELIQRSAIAMAAKGTANSASANAQIERLCASSGRKAPRRQAIGSKMSVASTMRAHAISHGESSCTASLMKK